MTWDILGWGISVSHSSIKEITQVIQAGLQDILVKLNFKFLAPEVVCM